MTEPAGSARSSGRLSPSRIRSTPADPNTVLGRDRPGRAADHDAPAGRAVRLRRGRRSRSRSGRSCGCRSGARRSTASSWSSRRRASCRRSGCWRRPPCAPTAVPPELVRLALWMADEYCSTPARALSLVLPPRGRPRTELWAERTPAPLDGARLSERQRALLAVVAAGRGRATSPRCGGWRRAGSSPSRRGRAGGRR